MSHEKQQMHHFDNNSEIVFHDRIAFQVQLNEIEKEHQMYVYVRLDPVVHLNHLKNDIENNHFLHIFSRIYTREKREERRNRNKRDQEHTDSFFFSFYF